MRWYRPILQTARDIKPPEAIFIQNKGSVAANCVETSLASGWPKLWGFVHRKIGVIVFSPRPNDASRDPPFGRGLRVLEAAHITRGTRADLIGLLLLCCAPDGNRRRFAPRRE
jgi:hypothetical protein